MNRWYGDVSEWFELPRNTITQAILTENTPCADPDRQVEDIREAPGYSSPVDHNSYGALQQQWQWWPMPWVIECAAWSFGYRMWQSKAEYGAEDKWGLSRWIQHVQQSAFSDGSNYAAKYEWSLELTADKSEPKPEQELWRTEGWYEPKARGSRELFYHHPEAS
jgi:hypothetical protein